MGQFHLSVAHIRIDQCGRNTRDERTDSGPGKCDTGAAKHCDLRSDHRNTLNHGVERRHVRREPRRGNRTGLLRPERQPGGIH